MKTRTYRLGLKCGGLMDGWHIESIQVVGHCASLEEAKEIWARRTGYEMSKYWDSRELTYWGWEVVEVTELEMKEYVRRYNAG